MGRALDLILGVNNRKLKRELRQSHGEVLSFGKSASASLRNAFSAGLGSFAGIGSAVGLAALGKSVLGTEEKLTRLGIQAGMSQAKLDGVRKVAVGVGREFGLTTDMVVDAGTALINLEGEAGFSAEKMRVLAKASVATGASMNDLAGIGFALKNAFNIKEADELEQALSAVTAAGKQGSVPLNEMGTVLQQIATKFGRVSAAGKEGAADLSAAIQVARAGFGSAAEVGTGIKAFIDQLDQAGPKLTAYGIRTTKMGKDGKEQLLPLRDIIEQIGASRLMNGRGSNFRMTQVFGSSEARQFLTTLNDNKAAFEELSEAARNANDVQADSQAYLSSTAGRMKMAIANARTEMESLVTPERLEKFVGIVTDKLVPGLEWAVDHAEELAAVFAGIKIAQASKAVFGLAGGMAKAASEAGGMAGMLGKVGGGAGGVLRSLLGWAGPIGLAGAAAWGLYEAFKGSRKEAEGLTSEQLKQAELSGKLAKGSQFDPTGEAATAKARADALRKEAKASNALLFSDDLGDRIEKERRRTYQIRGVEGMETRTRGTLTDEDVARTKELVEAFRTNRGVLSGEESSELEALLKKAGISKGPLRAGAQGIEAEKEAAKLEAKATAISELERLRFGQEKFSARGVDVGALAAGAGLTGEAAQQFQEEFLSRAGAETSGALRINETKNRRGRVTGRSLSLQRSELAVGEDGRIERRTTEVNPLSIEGAAAGSQAVIGALLGAMKAARTAGDVRRREEAASSSAALKEALASSEHAQVLREAMTSAIGAITFSIDGNAVFSAVQNTPANGRTPAQ
jgi:hypothetical protein